jgi:hypothetical protein
LDHQLHMNSTCCKQPSALTHLVAVTVADQELREGGMNCYPRRMESGVIASSGPSDSWTSSCLFLNTCLWSLQLWWVPMCRFDFQD